MSEHEQYPDPALARRFREWVDDAAPAAAPERLVYAVMDTVELVGRPRRRLVGMRLETMLQWVALTLVIAVGVTIGSLLSRPNPNVSSSPSPSASPSASGSTSRAPSSPGPSPAGAVPSLPTIDQRSFARAPGPSALGLANGSLWVGTPDGEVVELDAASGGERSRTSVGAEPITIIPYDGILWIGSGGPDLVWLDPSSRAVGKLPGIGGHVVLEGAGSLWVSRQGEFVRLDPATRTVIGSIPLPNHRASDLAMIIGNELWAGAGPSILRLALPSGDPQGTILGQPDAVLATASGVYGVDRGSFVRLAGPGGTDPLDPPIHLAEDLPQAYGQAVDFERAWFAGPMPTGAGEVVGVDLATGRVTSRTRMSGGPRALAFADGSLWVAVDDGSLARLAVP